MQSRYYNARTARFLSEDTASGKYTDPLSLNKYTYCHNQPVTGYDPDGHFLHILGGALLGGFIGAGASMISQLREKGSIDLRETQGGAAEGAIIGGAAAATGGASLAVSVAAGAEAGAAGNFVNQWISKGSLSKIDTTQVFTSAAANAMGEAGGKLGESLLKTGGKIADKVLGTAGKDAAAKAGGSVVQKGLKDCLKTGFKCGLGATTYDITKQVASGKGLTDIDWKEVGASAAIGLGLGMGAKALSNSKVGQKVSSAGEKIGEKFSSGLESLKETGRALATDNGGFASDKLMFGKKLTNRLAGGSQTNNKNVFPENPDDLLPEITRNKVTKSNGTTSQTIYTSDSLRIRAEQHPIFEGEKFNARHHGVHYHVEYRSDILKSWNNRGNVAKYYPEGYSKGGGTGFLPGESFPQN